MKTALLLLSVATLAACDGVGQACNLMYAPSNLTLSIDAEDDYWEEGSWLVEVDDLSCEFTLPADEATLQCFEDIGAELIDLTFSADGTTLESIRVEAYAPDSIELSLSLDGTEVFTETLSPTYTEDEPNGTNCGIRRVASEELELS